LQEKDKVKAGLGGRSKDLVADQHLKAKDDYESNKEKYLRLKGDLKSGSPLFEGKIDVSCCHDLQNNLASLTFF
jgi:hypothetical protein